jgi:DNA-binding MarR family transcriptional regulator
MTEAFRNSSAQSAVARVVALTDRDLDDATRLLKLLTESPDSGFPHFAGGSEAGSPHTILAAVRRELIDRRRRLRHFPEVMFGEAAWEILLLLYLEKDGRRFTVTALAEALDLPQNSTGRWLKYLETKGLVGRKPHHLDQRSVLAQLSEDGVRAVEAYFSGTDLGTR